MASLMVGAEDSEPEDEEDSMDWPTRIVFSLFLARYFSASSSDISDESSGEPVETSPSVGGAIESAEEVDMVEAELADRTMRGLRLAGVGPSRLALELLPAAAAAPLVNGETGAAVFVGPGLV